MHEGSSGRKPPCADSALPTLGANPRPHPWPEKFIVEGNWFSQQQQQLKPGQGSGEPEVSSAPSRSGWGPDRNPWPRGWGAGKPGMPKASFPVHSKGTQALHVPDMQHQTYIGVTTSDAMTGSAAVGLAAGPPRDLKQHKQSVGPVRLSELGDLGRPKARRSQTLSAQAAGQSTDSAQCSGAEAAPQVPGMQEPMQLPWPDAASWQRSRKCTGPTPQLPVVPHRASKDEPASAVPQVNA